MGPLRENLASLSDPLTHVPAMMRRQNSFESFLSAVGKLWTLHTDINFAALMGHGVCLPNLPRYPWNHQRKYWQESRVSKEWRFREHPHHDLLGVKISESSDIEPVWRNLFHLDNAPWVQEHKIKGEIVFPFASYVAMAAEAIGQSTGVRETVEFRHIIVNTALVVNEGTPIELITTLRRVRLTDFQDSKWWEFNISSFNDHSWIRHCSGKVRGQLETSLDDLQAPKDEDMVRIIDFPKWYARVYRGGLEYGSIFKTMEHGLSSTSGQHIAKVSIQKNWHSDKTNYHLHPICVDTYFQILSTAAHYGLTHAYRQIIPSSVESLRISRCDANEFTLYTSAERQKDTALGEGGCMAGSKTVMRISGARMVPLDSDVRTNDASGVPLTAQSEWVPHIDFVDFKTLVKPVWDNTTYMPMLGLLGNLVITSTQRSLSTSRLKVYTSDLQKYKAWLDQQTLPGLESTNSTLLTSQIDSLCSLLKDSSAAPAAAAIAGIHNNSISILAGEKGTLEVLDVDQTLDKLRNFITEHDASEFYRCLGQSKPNLRVLELGVGLSATATTRILEYLRRPDGQALYSRYLCTDTVPAIIASVEERFTDVSNLKFATLDITKDPLDQGFEYGRFDLIIAKGIIHETPDIGESLRNVHKLLAPEGRLMMQQPRPGLLWLKYVLATLPGWWCGGGDNRLEEPYIDLDRWDKELIAAGYNGLEFNALDLSERDYLNMIMVAKPKKRKQSSQRINLLYGQKEAWETRQVVKELSSRGYEISYFTIDEPIPNLQATIALLDMEKPFFETMDSNRFGKLKNLIDGLSQSKFGSLFWITHASQVDCRDPRYAPIIGLARTVRSELDLDFAVCETDDFISDKGYKAVIDVFQKFCDRETFDVLGPDFEYSVSNGMIRVNRVFPCSLHGDKQTAEQQDDALLQIGRLGRLDSLHWARQPKLFPAGDEVEVEVHAVGLNFRVSFDVASTALLPPTQ